MNSKKIAMILWFLLVLFGLRVLGQALVAFFNVSSLPPMEEWYSGLISYPVLLVTQLLIIILLAKVCLAFSLAKGFFIKPNRFFRREILYFGYIYLFVMVLRYVIRMYLFPEERWVGGAIPIVFHWVLASFVIIFGLFHRKQLYK